MSPKARRYESVLPRVKQMEALEASFPTIQSLLSRNLILQKDGAAAGDWDMTPWARFANETFSFAVLSKARSDGIPFPMHVHGQRAWLLCSFGHASIRFSHGRTHTLTQGDYLVIDSGTGYEVLADGPEQSTILIITIPADPGIQDVADSGRFARGPAVDA